MVFFPERRFSLQAPLLKWVEKKLKNLRKLMVQKTSVLSAAISTSSSSVRMQDPNLTKQGNSELLRFLQRKSFLKKSNDFLQRARSKGARRCYEETIF